MDCSRFNLLVIVISCLAVLALPIFVTGCGGSDDDDDENISGNVVSPDPEPVSEPTPQPEAQPEPEPQPEPQPQPELPPLPVPAPVVSFQEDILPILQGRCAVQGCHADPNPQRELNLETYAGFEKGSLGGVPCLTLAIAEEARLSNGLTAAVCHRVRPLDQDQIQLFKDWIDEGAKDN